MMHGQKNIKFTQLVKIISTPHPPLLPFSLPLFLAHLRTTHGMNVHLGPEYFDHSNSKRFGETWLSQNYAVKSLRLLSCYTIPNLPGRSDTEDEGNVTLRKVCNRSTVNTA
jgi:hypothetical protein